MVFDECYQLGSIVKTHGLNGKLVFFLDVDCPGSYRGLQSVFIGINGKLVPFVVKSFHLQGEKAIVALEEIEDLDSAKPLVGNPVYLPLSRLPKLKKGQYYFHQLYGFEVLEGEDKIGEVTGVVQLPNNNLLSVNRKGREILVPLTDEIVKKVDLDKKKIFAELPEGLLEVFTKP